MKGAHKFSPTSGAAVAREPDYPGTIPLRETLDGSGELTNGQLVSNGSRPLLRYFRRTHDRHFEAEDPALARAAARAIQQLRKQDPWDCWLWFALAERLHRQDHDVDWMLDHVEARCPRCSSRLQYEWTATGYDAARCASKCGNDSPDRTVEIVERILELYNAAFETDIDRLRLLDDVQP